MFDDFKAKYPNERNFMELLQDTFDHLNQNLDGTSSSLAKTQALHTTLSATPDATQAQTPTEFALEPGYPNPFNPSTTICYHLPEDAQVSIRIYNILGQEVRTLLQSRKEAGVHTIHWDGRNDSVQSVTSGTYLVRLVAEDFVGIQKLAFVK
ncbi:T9SS type A sorting domain-containing protein [candidate division KSB1 bacterium]|nr:T9SS type A sorting domain-containing protein [candidate division KSB1 bacterium]NIS27213.1 T9SS type A sorting domain-containing protein [candidate division KSB1 bacterium]NIT74098.1 T9SS type A sorting domain-containing protein [candidate division KSB1 bacterium]NIX73778.1 T9SS type A sorting domain-containing protein [candidate division KSB1 bacterium]